MELVLVRHGLPVRADASPDGRPADPGLADAGRAQAERVVGALAADPVTALYSSPALRARQTAAPLERALGLTAEVLPGLAEFDVDDPTYVPVEELRAAGDPRWHAIVRGEIYSPGVDPEAFRARVLAACEQVVAAHPGGRAVLFTHAGVCNALLGALLAQERMLFFAPAYCSLQRVAAARDGRRAVTSLNETGHVRDLLGMPVA